MRRGMNPEPSLGKGDVTAPVDRRTVLVRGSATLCLAATCVPAMPTALAPGDSGLPGSYGRVTPLFKRLTLLRRAPSLTHEEFVDRWRRSVAPQHRGLAGLTKYVFNIADPGRSVNFPYDGADEFWFESEAALLAAFDTGRATSALSPDVTAAARLLQPESPSMVSREIILRDPPAPGAQFTKRIGLLNRAAGWSDEEFAREWRDVHAPKVNQASNLAGYTVDIVDRRLSPDCPWAGFASLWWQSPSTVAGAASRPAPAPPGNDDPFAPALALMGEEFSIL